jgi:hypothetical protein
MINLPARIALAVLLTFCVIPVHAQESGTLERLLVPISVHDAPGAYGTLWATELWCRNNSTHTVGIFPLALSDFALAPRWTEVLRIATLPPAAPGLFLYVDRDDVDDLQFDLRLFNEADPAASWGTKLPVVREREFAGTVNLINVPTASDFRSTLRVYGWTPTDQPVTVRIYSNNEVLLATAALSLQGMVPYAAILSLADTFPAIRKVDRVRVEVTSPNSETKLWAFVSVTSNATQNIGLVTPE